MGLLEQLGLHDVSGTKKTFVAFGQTIVRHGAILFQACSIPDVVQEVEPWGRFTP